MPLTIAPLSLSATTPSGSTALVVSAGSAAGIVPAVFAPLSLSATTPSGPTVAGVAGRSGAGVGVGACPVPFRRRAVATPPPPPIPPPPPPFSQAPILDVAATVSDAQLRVSWASTAAPGTRYQVYLDRRLVWAGTATFCVLPYPTAAVRIDVGVAAAAQARADLSAALPSVPGGGGRLAVAWLGGSFQGATTAAFNVYLGAAPGAAPNLNAAPAAVVAAYPQGLRMDGFGMGGFGQGGFGAAASSYAWTSDPLAPGVWNVAVAAVDSAGNVGSAQTLAATVNGPPPPPARDAQGVRLTATPGRLASPGPDSGGFGQGGYGVGGFGVGGLDGAPIVTLNWLAPN